MYGFCFEQECLGAEFFLGGMLEEFIVTEREQKPIHSYNKNENPTHLNLNVSIGCLFQPLNSSQNPCLSSNRFRSFLSTSPKVVFCCFYHFIIYNYPKAHQKALFWWCWYKQSSCFSFPTEKTHLLSSGLGPMPRSLNGMPRFWTLTPARTRTVAWAPFWAAVCEVGFCGLFGWEFY